MAMRIAMQPPYVRDLLNDGGLMAAAACGC